MYVPMRLLSALRVFLPAATPLPSLSASDSSSVSVCPSTYCGQARVTLFYKKFESETGDVIFPFLGPIDSKKPEPQ